MKAAGVLTAIALALALQTSLARFLVGGTAALDLVSTYFRDRGNTEMWTTAGEGEGSPIPFYERYGFVRTGDIVFDDEVLLRLDLA